MSSADIDGSHTTALREGEQVAFQTRKMRKTTNAIYLPDRQGLPLAMSTPIAGNHHDLYNIENSVDELFDTLQKANISTDGLFINADTCFDAKDFREICFRHGVIANVAFNSRNEIKEEEYHWMKNCMNKDMLLKEPMLGWIATEPYSIDLRQQYQVGKLSII